MKERRANRAFAVPTFCCSHSMLDKKALSHLAPFSHSNTSSAFPFLFFFLLNVFRKKLLKIPPLNRGTKRLKKMDGLNETLEDAALVEEFQVDDLLDLRELPEPEKEEEEEDDDDEVAKKVVFVAFENKESLHLLGINLPEETDAADLEWLSGFVHDCHSEHQPAFATTTEKQPSPAAVRRLKNEIFIPVKAKRSKRHRRAGNFWSISTNSSVSSTSSPSTSSSSSSSYLSQEAYRKKLAGERKCSHCGVQKTPQWRAGPNGPKTLCNACGVRFKSGRLLPEYRPACSPTFVSNLHSNKHRKVLEMRRKEAAPPVQTHSG